ncbi:cob(I)yrinic acid a,c-diamide adenosyltransferase [Comamonas guangdongensis]|uniref:Corrinoid adenosyltransferase n=1 Tax=Comamonas guangdongensis TaxID=510515 RepID=A0ABV4A022_9BURK
MNIETPPTEKPYEKPEGERRGLVIVNTGDGKGKSTAAFGLAFRATGRGKAVKVFQFMKVPTARFGEHRLAERVGLPIEGLGDGFSWKSKDLEQSGQLARDGWEKAKADILSGEQFLVVLDEITYPLIYGWLPLEDVLETLKSRPSDVHVCLTGRRCPQEIIDIADTVTEMKLVKHAFQAGIPAQRGIED